MGDDITLPEAEKPSSEAVKRNIFKENWLKTDKVCSHCGQVTEKQKGLTKQNLKRLYTIKFDMNEIIWTLVVILILILAFAYKSETATCREWIGPMFEGSIDNCINVCDKKCNTLALPPSETNFPSNFTFGGEG